MLPLFPDFTDAGLLRWPGDAVMVVASPPGEAVVDEMDEVNQASCRDCGCEVLYSSYTFDRAIRFGRVVRFFCTTCVLKYDPRTIQKLEDHRGG